MTVSDLSERALVARIQQQLAPPPPCVTIGIGDDAAVVESERNRLEVLTVDALVDGVHFDRRFTSPEDIGHRALAVNLSDLAAMGATPRLALLSLALPASLDVADFDGIIRGIAALAAAHRVALVGGNLTRTPGPLTIDITAIGAVKRRCVLTRGGARAGDLVYVSGSIGAAAAGLHMLQESPDAAGPCADRYRRPEPRVKLGQLLGRNRAASACVDLSDGLADGVTRIAEASGVGMAIDASALPIDPDARRWFEHRGADPVQASLAGGDDYELLFTVRPRLRGRLKTACRHAGVNVTRIGVCTPDRALFVTSPEGGPTALPAGFSHFR